MDTSRFHELTPIEMDFIKDPNSWMPPEAVEDFLGNIAGRYGPYFADQKIEAAVGHTAPKLEAWGDLDLMLKLTWPTDIYEKIENILQWFITPLSLKAFQKREELMAFQLNFSSKKYPHITDYMRAVLEVLPVFKSAPAAEASWEGEKVLLRFSPQMTFLMDEDLETINPSLISKLKKNLFLLEKDYLKQKKRLEEQDLQIKKFQEHYFKKEKIKRLCLKTLKLLDQVRGAGSEELEAFLVKCQKSIEDIKKQIHE